MFLFCLSWLNRSSSAAKAAALLARTPAPFCERGHSIDHFQLTDSKQLLTPKSEDTSKAISLNSELQTISGRKMNLMDCIQYFLETEIEFKKY